MEETQNFGLVFLFNLGRNAGAMDDDIDINGPRFLAIDGFGGHGNAPNNQVNQGIVLDGAMDHTNGVDMIVFDFMQRVRDDWGFVESRAVYVLYVRHLGDFPAMRNDPPDSDHLGRRTVEEMVAKINQDHLISLEAGLPAPWILIDRAVTIERVAPMGNADNLLRGSINVGVPIEGGGAVVPHIAHVANVAELATLFDGFAVDPGAAAADVGQASGDVGQASGVVGEASEGGGAGAAADAAEETNPDGEYGEW